MPSLSGAPLVWLLRKEWRELQVSRAWWLLLLLMGPLSGVSFISAVRTYAEVSGLNGTAAGVGEALSPLIGVWGPTFGACELAAVFLLPFVAIKVVGADRQSGAVKLELQRKLSPFARMGAKFIVALCGWLIAMLPALSALVLWEIYGGSLYMPELATLVCGHVLNGVLTIALGAAAASLTDHPSTAAILTLGTTVSTWIINFFAAVQGGLWERVAAFTPTAFVADFQHGLLRLDATLVGLLLAAAGLGIGSIWQRMGVPVSRRALESCALFAVAAVAILVSSMLRPSWDTSENRGNSLPKADEAMLRSIQAPLRIVAHLAPEDPRRADLEKNAFSKLRRLLPHVGIEYVSATSIGLFEQTREGYGEIWYEVSGRKEMSRATTVEGVLESIYAAAKIEPPKDLVDAPFRGHPLAVPPSGAAVVFYGLWPGFTLLCGVLVRRRFK